MNLDRIGKYRIVGRVGKGAMGEVFKAEDPLLNRFVAVKTIATALAAEEEFRRRFQREAQSAAALSHPNIVTVFDFGEVDGLVYMAMEFVEGRELRDLIRSRALSLGDKLSIVEQLCDGVGFAHSKGIVHRDLKPGNVRVQPDGLVKILDFGLARLGDSVITRTGTVMGTPNYMSPEQIRGRKVDARSDVFSLGGVLYELLSGHRPFEADAAHDVRILIVSQEPEPLARRVPDLPDVLVAVVEKALTKDPAGRFADAAEMGRALAAARETLESDAPAEGTELASLSLSKSSDATQIRTSPPGSVSVRGATVLAPAVQSHPRTFRPEATVVAAGPAAGAPVSPSGSRAIVFASVVVAVAALAISGVLWLRLRHATAPTGVAQEQAATVTDVIVANQLELARGDLADGDYERAAGRAEEALKLRPESAEARQVRDQARETRRRVEEAVAQTRAAFGRGDVEDASAALGRVMALAPRHPVVAELSAALKQHFRPQAEDSRRLAEAARKGADGARATASADYAQGRQLASEADAFFQREDYASATQRFLESRIAFDRARRLADQPRAVASVAPSAGPSLTPGPQVAAPVASAPTPPGLQGAPAVSAATLAAAPPPAVAADPPAAQVESPEAEVRRVIAEYGRAIGNRDLALFRSVKPNLTADEERRLREAFKAVKSQVVGIRVESIQIDGDRALVKVARQDTIDGKPMKPMAQVFQMARSGSTWAIQSIGQ
jgi:hypothetical protein